MNNKSCIKCYWSKTTSIPGFIQCKYFTSEPNKIEGHITLGNCSDIRKEKPNCPAWLQGGIKGFFQRLFK